MDIRDLMTADPVVCSWDTDLRAAATAMRDRHIGDVLVRDGDGHLCGIVTDRDLVVRGLARRADIETMTLADVCDHELHTVRVDASVGDVIRMMQERTIRRAPVMDGDELVGIVSLGDLAARLDADSVLGAISKAAPDD